MGLGVRAGGGGDGRLLTRGHCCRGGKTMMRMLVLVLVLVRMLLELLSRQT